MLFKPVYLKGKKMLEAPITMAPAPPPPPPPPEPELEPHAQSPIPPQPHSSRSRQPEAETRLAILVCNNGFKHVFPKESTKDVLTGKVPYMLVDETGVTRFEPKHILNALKLDREHLEKYEDYECIGGHHRILEEKPKKIRYKRRYISMDFITKGIY